MLCIEPAPKPRLDAWEEVCNRIHTPEGEVTIAIVGKYTGLKDAYKSLIEALYHGGIANRVKVKLEWIESEIFEKEDPSPWLEKVNGILVPGGFGERGNRCIKMTVIQFINNYSQENIIYQAIVFN